MPARDISKLVIGKIAGLALAALGVTLAALLSIVTMLAVEMRTDMRQLIASEIPSLRTAMTALNGRADGISILMVEHEKRIGRTEAVLFQPPLHK